jgi:hypothetical protein
LKEHPYVATRSATKPGVGEIILTTRWWKPKAVRKVRFRPVGTEQMHPVDPDSVGDLLLAQTVEQAMAVVRRSPATRT